MGQKKNSHITAPRVWVEHCSPSPPSPLPHGCETPASPESDTRPNVFHTNTTDSTPTPGRPYHCTAPAVQTITSETAGTKEARSGGSQHFHPHLHTWSNVPFFIPNRNTHRPGLINKNNPLIPCHASTLVSPLAVPNNRCVPNQPPVAVTPPLPTRRNAELALLCFAALITVAALLIVEANQERGLRWDLIGYGLIFLLVFGSAHLTIRRFAPYTDPLLLPIVALLNGLGLVMIHRLDLVNNELSGRRHAQRIPTDAVDAGRCCGVRTRTHVFERPPAARRATATSTDWRV